MSLYTQVESNIVKTWFYLTFFFILIIMVGWLISYLLENQVIFWFSLIFSFLTNFLAYWYSDRFVLALSKAKPIKKEDFPELYRIVENLSITAGLPLPQIYIIDEDQPNAFATGRNPKHSVVAVTRGLLEKLDKTELEGVISHELAHIGNNDTLLATIVVILVGLVVKMIELFFRIGYRRDFSRDKSERRLDQLLILGGIILLLLSPFLATLIRLAISRKREFLADATGALLTRYPEGLARALEKISKDKTTLRVASHATSHLYIINPFREQGKGFWFHKLFMTHPPVEERIKILRSMKI
jgi:heat shock protein HtpX